MPSLRQLLILVVIWALAGWLTVSFVMVKSVNAGYLEALTRYYSVRAPLVSAGVALLTAPLLASGGFARAAVGPSRKWALRLLQGAILGNLVAIAVTILLLFLWPNEMQNGRLDAVRWSGFYWYNYGWVLSPA